MGAGQSTYDLNDNQRAHLSPRMQAGTSTAIGDDMEASGSGVSTTTAGSAARSAWSYKATDQKGGGSNGDHQTDRQTSSTAQAKSKVRIDGGHSVRYSESYPVDVSDAIGLGAVTNAVTMGAMLPPPGPPNVRTLLSIGALFALGTLTLYNIYASIMPKFETDVKLPPRNLDDVKELVEVMSHFQVTNPTDVLAIFCATYIFMQTFAIPGGIFLSVLAGSLYGLAFGLAAVVSCCVLGSSLCYFISYTLGRPLVYWMYAEKMVFFNTEINKHRNNLLSYMLFLRCTPIFPNGFVTIASPIIGIPFGIFAVSTIVGLCVTQLIPVSAGERLRDLRSINELYSPGNLAFVTVIGMIFLAPVFVGSLAAVRRTAAGARARLTKLARSLGRMRDGGGVLMR